MKLIQILESRPPDQIVTRELDEVVMSPNALNTWVRQNASAVENITIGFEAEMCIPDLAGSSDDDDYETEPDYSMDEYINNGWQSDVRAFFSQGDNPSARRDITSAIESCGEDMDGWITDDISKSITAAEVKELIASNNPDWSAQEIASDYEDMGDQYSTAMDELMASYHENFEFSDWARPNRCERMSQFSDRYNLLWPYWRSNQSSGQDYDYSTLARSWTALSGYKSTVSSGYHDVKRQPGLWIFEPDSSIEPSDSDDGGVELVSPPMPFNSGYAALTEFFAWSAQAKAYANDSCGFHIGVSLPQEMQQAIDPVKLLLFLGDEYVLAQFGRSANNYTKSSMRALREKIQKWFSQNSSGSGLAFIKSTLADPAQSVLPQIVRQGDRQVSVNIKDNYIEFRSAGGNYFEKQQEIFNTVIRYVRAMTIASDPQAEKQEYLKKLYKLLDGSIQQADNPVGAFMRYTTGKITREELLKILKPQGATVPDPVTENISLAQDHQAPLDEKWSKSYKKGIDCAHPRGFSQKAHCAARRKRKAGGKTTSKSVSETFNINQSQVTEIAITPEQQFGQDHILQVLHLATQQKNLIHGFEIYIYDENDTRLIAAWDNKNKQLAAAAVFQHMPKLRSRLYVAKNIEVFPQYQGQRLAGKLYKYCCEVLDMTIQSDLWQSASAKSLWTKTLPALGLHPQILDTTTNRTFPPDKIDPYKNNNHRYCWVLEALDNYPNNLSEHSLIQPYRGIYAGSTELAKITNSTAQENRMDALVETLLQLLQTQGLTEAQAVAHIDERLDENLRKWFQQKWVRFGPDGKIRGACSRGKPSEGKPKCLPQKQAWALGKKKRAAAARRKRQQDPNPNRQGPAHNVSTQESMTCPHCGGAMVELSQINEKTDACYYKVKSRYKVWPSAYASGALVQCRKQGARNWGTKKESVDENFADGQGPGRPGDSQRHGIPKNATISQLTKAAKSKGRKGQLARWQLNMRRGQQKESLQELFDPNNLPEDIQITLLQDTPGEKVWMITRGDQKWRLSIDIGIGVPGVWEVAFSSRTRGMAFDITGDGGAPQLFAAVGAILYRQAKNNTDVQGYLFTAKEPSRIKLYTVLSKKLAAGLSWVYDPKMGEQIMYWSNEKVFAILSPETYNYANKNLGQQEQLAELFAPDNLPDDVKIEKYVDNTNHKKWTITRGDQTWKLRIEHNNHPKVWEGFFSSVTKKMSFGITGEGSAPQIFGAVYSILVMEANRDPDIKGYLFAAKEPSRRKLYRVLSRKLSQQLKWVYDPSVGRQLRNLPNDEVFAILSPETYQDVTEKLSDTSQSSAITEAKPAGVKSYQTTWRGATAEYDPEFFDVEPDELRDEAGRLIASKERLRPRATLQDRLPTKANPALVYRGMSNAEYQHIQQTGRIESRGDYNFDVQKGLTYFSTDPQAAESYAHSFAPWQHKANWDNPAWVIAIPRPDPSRVRKVAGTGEHEVGIEGSIPASEIREVYRGRAVEYRPGEPDREAPSAWLHWERVSGTSSSILNENTGKSLTIWDIDDTLMHTTARVFVVEPSGRRRQLSASQFNSYDLRPGEKYDFSEFTDSQLFYDTSKPIEQIWRTAKNTLANIGKRPGSRMIIVTARAEFDNTSLFLKTFEKHGMDMSKVKVYTVAGASNKKPLIHRLLGKGQFTECRLFDDHPGNLQDFLSLHSDFPDIQLKAFPVSHNGTVGNPVVLGGKS